MDFSGFTAIYGGPGTGKTALAASIAHRRLADGQRVLWVTFYEDKQTLIDSMAKLGYDLNGADIWEAVLADPTSTFNQISHLVSHSPPNLFVLDSISQLQMPDVRQNLTNLFYRAFKFAGIDAIVISEEPPGPLAHIADNLIRLSLEFTERGVPVRRMYVQKARGRPAGYVREFEMVEGVGIVFLDELAPRPRGASALQMGVSKLDEFVAGAKSALVVGDSSADLLAAEWAASLARSGRKVLFRTYRGQAPPAVKSADVAVDFLSADPARYGVHIYDLVRRVDEVGADVVFYEGVEVEALAYGRRLAYELNAKKLSALRKAGVALVLVGARSYGLESLVDVRAVARRSAVVFIRPFAPPISCKLSGGVPTC
ncbi:MAG: RAD55 family ATPase [Thermoproteus sp.]